MPVPIIPIVRYWGNPTDYKTDFNINQISPGGIIDIEKKHFINRTLRDESISAVVTNFSELNQFLLDRNGKPFQYQVDGQNTTGIYTCIQWSFTWLVYVSGGASATQFTAVFNENVNPQNE